jgi:N-acetylmuramic acid 6-phosphate etherase
MARLATNGAANNRRAVCCILHAGLFVKSSPGDGGRLPPDDEDRSRIPGPDTLRKRPAMAPAPRVPVTEKPNPASRGLDTRPLAGILRLMHREDARAVRAVGRALPRVAAAARRLVATLERGGRCLLAGAGTSGRLAAAEAAECPPTFRTPPGQFAALLAGGPGALRRAVEGAEDDTADGARQVRAARVGPRDLVVGIAASGGTPFVRGVLAEARRRGAATILVTCVPRPALAPLADIVLPLVVGPEILAGSTRLKTGTATKLVLNMLTTAAMARLGKIHDNLMIDVRPTNAKLRDRATRIVAAVAHVPPAAARRHLARAGGDVKAAVLAAARGVPPAEARRLLRLAKGRLRAALALAARRA